jgi:hypothetical protein
MSSPFRVQPPRSSGVQIEVLSEADYAEEEQRANEEAAQRREEERKRKAAKADGAAAAASSSAARAAASSSDAQAAAAQPHSSSSASDSRWPALLAPLHLPPFMATLHDTRVYDAASYARLSGEDVVAFRRSAAAAFKQLGTALDGLVARSSAAESSRAANAELRPFLTPLLCACIRFLLPSLPSPPTPLAAPSSFGSGTDMASSDDWDPESLPPSMAERAAPFELVWQNEALTALALQVLQKLAYLFRFESDAQSLDDAGGGADATLSASATAAAGAGNIDGVMSSPSMQRFFAWALPTHLLPFLRQEMRSGTATGVTGSTGSNAAALAAAVGASLSGADSSPPVALTTTQEWKQARHFPSAFFVCFLSAHLAPSTLASELRPLLALLLPLLDDHELHLKVAGLASLQRLVRVVPSMYFGDGWGNLLLRSLKTILSFKEASILALAVPTFVQTYMALFPPVLLHDYSTMQLIHPAQSAATTTSTTANFSFSSSAVAAASSSSSSDAPLRLAAHDALLDALLHEMSYLALSPSLDNLFATFVYAQTLLPTLLYVGPLVVCKRLQTLLPIVLQWCTGLVAPVQRRLVKLGWEVLECMLTLELLGQHLAHQHVARIVEAAAQGWINEEDITQQQQQQQQQQRKRQQRGNNTSTSGSVIVRTHTVPLSDSHFHARYTSQPTIAHCMQLLRRLVPDKFEPIWQELQQMPELTGLALELRKLDA